MEDLTYADPSLTESERDFYTEALKLAKEGPASTGYGRPVNQSVRFMSFWDHNKFGGNYSLLDIGCGTGDLLNDAKKFDIGMPGHYVGYDRDERMIDVARERFEGFEHPQSFSVDFCVGDAVVAQTEQENTFDVVACIATLALKPEDWDQSVVLDYVVGQIESMASMASHLVFVTLFSPWKNKHLPDEMLVDPATIFNWAMQKYGRVQIDHSYAPHDYALAIHMDEGRWWQEYEG